MRNENIKFKIRAFSTYHKNIKEEKKQNINERTITNFFKLKKNTYKI